MANMLTGGRIEVGSFFFVCCAPALPSSWPAVTLLLITLPLLPHTCISPLRQNGQERSSVHHMVGFHLGELTNFNLGELTNSQEDRGT